MPDTTAVDVHTHAMPLTVLEWLAAHGLGEVFTDRDVVTLDPQVSGVGPGAPLPLARSQYDAGVRLREMDDAGVSHHLVSLPPFLFCSNATDAALATEVVQRGNDGLAQYVADAPHRLAALGSVPVGWPQAAQEARRCLDDLGAVGIAIGTRGAGLDLDAPANDDLWALLAERQTFVFLHPSGVPDAPRQRDFWLPQLVGYPMETALAVARLTFSGVLERHDLRLCLSHGGGCVPSLLGRLDLGWERKSVARTTRARPSELIRNLYVDTAVFSTPLLHRLVEDFGAKHVLLGSDHPFELADRDPAGSVRALGLDPSATEAILYGNVRELLPHHEKGTAVGRPFP
jgi:aminocarboxymuconate-semialdehyde decarboxylase